ncbi:MAG: extracellular solute-binding protein [Desulfovibrionaceae bacterium]
MDEINAANWADILLRKDVVWGHSDPNLDPCGYRSLMVLQLAEKFDDRPGYYQQALDNRPMKNVRPKSVELISLLQSGNMDSAGEYLSVAVQHGLKYVTLDPHVNLSDSTLDPFYKQATVEVSGKQPGETITRIGSSITYGITLLDQAPNKEAAEAFLKYLFSPDGGLAVLQAQGQPPFSPVRVGSQEMLGAMPAGLAPLVEVGGVDEVFGRPATPFAARFVGMKNLLPAGLVGGGSGLVAIRPEDAELLPPEQDADRTAGGAEREKRGPVLPCLVERVFREGFSWAVVLACGEHKLTVRLSSEQGAAGRSLPGTRARVLLPAHRLHRLPHAAENDAHETEGKNPGDGC